MNETAPGAMRVLDQETARKIERDMLADAAIGLVQHLERNSMIDEATLKAMLNLKSALVLCGYRP